MNESSSMTLGGHERARCTHDIHFSSSAADPRRRRRSERAGRVGGHQPCAGTAGLDGYELRALSASSTESARAAGEKYAVPLTFSRAAELARSAEVDLVVVTVK